MLRERVVAISARVTLVDLECSPSEAGWVTPPDIGEFAVTFVRKGVFRRRTKSGAQVLDPTTVFLESPCLERDIAHPEGCGDTTTSIAIAPWLAEKLGLDRPVIRDRAFRADPHLFRDLHLFRTSAPRMEAVELEERLIVLVGDLLEHGEVEPVIPARRSSEDRRKLVDAARLAILSDPRLGVVDLAALLSCSPHHLSRSFHQILGRTISRFRQELRLNRAIERLAGGEGDLASLAREVGFSDHAHMTRSLGKAIHAPPSAFRASLSQLRMDVQAEA